MTERSAVIDVFAGAGGLSLGFEQAGFAPALGVDSDERARAAYAANFPEAVALAGRPARPRRSSPAAGAPCTRRAVTARFREARPGEQERISRFHRLHPDRPSPTIRAGTLGGHGGHTAPRPIHYAFPRCITVREAARLQSMPDWFRADPADGTNWRGFMQVGNAVPPLLARAVAEAIRLAVQKEGPERMVPEDRSRRERHARVLRRHARARHQR